MRRTLAIATLALGLFAFGCDDEEDGKPDAGTKLDATADAVTPAPDAKVDVVTATDVTTADAADGGVDPDAAASDGGPTSWTTCTSPKSNVTTQEFCLQYMSACGYNPAATAVGSERYANFSDCAMKYEALSVAKRGCVAYHLCVASVPTNAALHCPHPPEASLTTPAGPCAN